MKMDRKRLPSNGRCPPPEDVVASVLDGEMDAESELLRDHVESCPACQKLAEAARASVALLREAEVVPTTRDLVAGVLARIPQSSWRDRTRESRREQTVYSLAAWMPMRIAAVAFILMGSSVLVLHFLKGTPKHPTTPTSKVSAVDKGVEWLLARQTSAGGWNVEELGGRPEYAPALNGLAVLALTRAESETSDLRGSLGRAGAFLLRQQVANGRLGKDFDGTMYNHGIATLALLEVYCITQDERWREPITKALAFIRARQSAVGGWGYRDNQSSLPNTSITAWQVQSLLLADRLGWHDNRITVRKALAWMAGTVNGNGYFGYERAQQFPEGPNTLTMMGAYCMLAAQDLDIPVDSDFAARVVQGMGTLAGEKPNDYYAAFFYSSALAQGDPDTFGNALVAAQETLIARQQTIGGDMGNWLADDRWGSAGGQLYSTSMALMSLTPLHGHSVAFRD